MSRHRFLFLALILCATLMAHLQTGVQYAEPSGKTGNVNWHKPTRAPPKIDKCVAERLRVDPEKRILHKNSEIEAIPVMIVPLMLDVYDFAQLLCNISVPIRRLFLVQNMEEPMLKSYLNEMEETFGWSGRLLVRRHPENIGYSGAVNEGWRFAMSLPREEAPFVFVTNSDVEFSPDILPQLLRDVHNLTAHDAARMDELTKQVSRETSAYSPPNRRLKVLRSPDGNGIVSTSALLPDRIRYAPRDERVKAFADHYAIFTMGSGFTSFFVSRLAISTVGFFDENFFPAYFEDPDYYWRLLKLGFREFRATSGSLTHNPGLNNRVVEEESALSFSIPARWWRRVKSFGPTYGYALAKWNTTKPHLLEYVEPFNGTIPLDTWVLDAKRNDRVRRFGFLNTAKRPNRMYNRQLLITKGIAINGM